MQVPAEDSDEENLKTLLGLEADEDAKASAQRGPPSFSSLDEFKLFLPTELKLVVDASPGCGGHIWPSAVVLTRYLAHLIKLDPQRYRNKTCIELGAGTGVLACAVATLDVPGFQIYSTDLLELLPLARQNVALNGLEDKVKVAELAWGQPLPPDVPHKPDVLLLADCIYLEPTFPWLVETMCLLASETTEILLCYKKRRKADKRFFHLLKRHFDWEDVSDDPHKAKYDRDGLHLFSVKKRAGTNR